MWSIAILLLYFISVFHIENIESVNPKTGTPLSSYEVVMSWRKLEFNFSLTETGKQRILENYYLPGNNVFTGIEVSRDRIFLAIPRWRDGVPATLAYVPYDSRSMAPNSPTQQKTNSPLLNPYPNWAFQEVGNCSALQYVQTIEIDMFNRLWIVDTGIHHSNFSEGNGCPPKLVLIDLDTDKIVLSYDFPKQVVDWKENLLRDLVIACQNLNDSGDCWAYITDSAGAKLVIFHLRNKQSWAVRHSTMKANASANLIPILGHDYVFDTSINGLALSPYDSGFDKLYFCALSSYNLYSIPTAILKMAGANGYSSDLSDADVTFIGSKFSQSDGLAMTSNGLLLYGDLSSNAISFWNSSNKVIDPAGEILLVQNDIDLQWADSFSFDGNGYVYVTTNRIQRALSGTYDFEDVNFRISRIYIGSKSYLYHTVNDKSTKSYGTRNGVGLILLVSILIISILNS